MSTIVTRSGKGSPLTHTEVDNNFTNLNTDKLQSGDTAASLTITSADINGGSIDGTAIGASTASTGSFTSLTDSGNLTFTGTGNRITGDFSGASLPNRTMLQTSTTNGNTLVGFIPNGTGASTAARFFNSSSAENCANFDVGMLIAGTEARLASSITGTGTYVPMTFATGGSERLRIDTSGNVGIGTSSPTGKLQIDLNTASTVVNSVTLNNNAGGAGNGAAINFYNSNATQPFTSRINSLDDGNFGFHTVFSNKPAGSSGAGALTERMRIDSSGNMGIGTDAPAQKLHVSNTSTVGIVQLGGTGTTGYFSQLNQTNNDLTIIANGDQAYRASLGTNNGSGNIVFQTATGTTGNTTRARITAAGLLQFNSGYGSVATAYGCRAWVNFSGTGTVVIRVSGNVSSITDNGTGNYRVNFSTALVDANYSVVAGASKDDGTNDGNFHAQVNGFSNGGSNGNTVNNTTVVTGNSSPASLKDCGVVTVAVFR